MTAFYITPYEPTQWKTAKSNLKIDPLWYKQRLSEYWSGIQFIHPSESAVLAWGFLTSEEGGRIFGMLHANLQVVSLDTPYEEFFLWHRGIVPGEHRLFLSNDSSPASLELTSSTTLEDLKQFCGGQAN